MASNKLNNYANKSAAPVFISSLPLDRKVINFCSLWIMADDTCGIKEPSIWQLENRTFSVISIIYLIYFYRITVKQSSILKWLQTKVGLMASYNLALCFIVSVQILKVP